MIIVDSMSNAAGKTVWNFSGPNRLNAPHLVFCENSLFAGLEGRRLAMDSEGSFVS